MWGPRLTEGPSKKEQLSWFHSITEQRRKRWNWTNCAVNLRGQCCYPHGWLRLLFDVYYFWRFQFICFKNYKAVKKPLSIYSIDECLLQFFACLVLKSVNISRENHFPLQLSSTGQKCRTISLFDWKQVYVIEGKLHIYILTCKKKLDDSWLAYELLEKFTCVCTCLNLHFEVRAVDVLNEVQTQTT